MPSETLTPDVTPPRPAREDTGGARGTRGYSTGTKIEWRILPS
jgi:hypothetical protein